MPFCTSCGSQMEGQFCTKCGAQASGGVQPAPPSTPVPAPPGGAAPKKRSPLLWVLVGCFGLLVIAAIIAVSGGLFIAHKAKEAGIDPDLAQRNPALAVTKLLAAINPDVEVVSVNERDGLITLREKSTGKTVTVNFEDIKKGRIVFEGEGGEKVEIEGGGAAAKLPDWLPAYPGARAAGGATMRSEEGSGGTVQLETNDSVEQVAAFYEKKLKDAGLKTARTAFEAGSGGFVTLTGGDEGEDRHASVTVTKGDKGTAINITFSAK